MQAIQPGGAHRCPYCDSTVTVHQAINPGHCGARACFEQHLTTIARKRREAHHKERVRLRARATAQTINARKRAAEWMDVPVDTVQVATVPHQRKPVVALPQDRRDAFLSHLDEILETGTPPEDPADRLSAMPNTPAPPSKRVTRPLQSAACAACQGMCCTWGGGTTYAFLTAEIVADHHAARPHMSLTDIRNIYANALPNASVKDSCVYHGVEGCSLDRDWRPPPCNQFVCDSITALNEVTAPDNSGPLAIVALQDDVALKMMAFSHATGGQVIPLVDGTSERDAD